MPPCELGARFIINCGKFFAEVEGLLAGGEAKDLFLWFLQLGSR